VEVRDPRSLTDALESVVALSPDGAIDLSLLPDGSPHPAGHPAPPKFSERVAAYERGLIVAALETATGNQSEAARLLDIGRTTLQDKMRKYSLSYSDNSSEREK
jgi:two-component system response regulator HydG